MKKFISLLMTVAMVLGISSIAFATTFDVTPTGGTGMQNIGKNVLGYIQWFGYAVAVGMLLYIGIKYMMASANEKADLKKGSISYVIGAIIVVAASTLFGILGTVANEVVVS
ncbi:MAG: hypothetical protein IJX99_04350 [Clostridia bacterium]|nr:hypothetical protein [Clostridia bacterium]